MSYKVIVLEVPVKEVEILDSAVEVPEVEFHNFGYVEICPRQNGKVLVQVFVDGDSDKQSVDQSVIDNYGATVPGIAGE